MSTPAFPPLLYGHALSGQDEPFDIARQKAVQGCDAGLLAYNVGQDQMAAALVLAPEVSLSKAMAMLPACGVGFQNALGALAPPEVAVHLDWDGRLRVNGAFCGRFRIAAEAMQRNEVPDWLVVGFELRLLPPSRDTGLTPEETALYAEGCTEVKPHTLLEAWARHTLHWIARWEEQGGAATLHREWRGLVPNIGEDIEQNGNTGHFLGTDEDFGMLLRRADRTDVLPLTTVLEE